jgi:hypothetical protein
MPTKIGKDGLGNSGDILRGHPSIYQNAKPIAKLALQQILIHALPPTNVIYNAYKLADTIYDNWSLIQQVLKDTEEGKLAEATITTMEIGSNIVLKKINEFATPLIDLRFQQNNKEEIDIFLRTLTNYLIDSDIDVVDHYFEECRKDSGKKASINIKKQPRNTKMSKSSSYKEKTNYKEEMGYV